MRTLCKTCNGKGWVKVDSHTGGAPPYDRCPGCRGAAWITTPDATPKPSPSLAACLMDAATRRGLPYFANLRDGELMQVARRVTVRDCLPLLALIGAVVLVLAVPA